MNMQQAAKMVRELTAKVEAQDETIKALETRLDTIPSNDSITKRIEKLEAFGADDIIKKLASKGIYFKKLP